MNFRRYMGKLKTGAVSASMPVRRFAVKPFIFPVIVVIAMSISGSRFTDLLAIRKAGGRNTAITNVAEAFFKATDLKKVDFSDDVKKACANQNFGIRFIKKLAFVDKRVRKNLHEYAVEMFEAQKPIVKIHIKFGNGETVPTPDLLDALKTYKKHGTKAYDALQDATDGLPDNKLTAPLQGMVDDAESRTIRLLHDVRTAAKKRTGKSSEELSTHVDQLLCNNAKKDPGGFLKRGGRGLYKITIGAFINLLHK